MAVSVLFLFFLKVVESILFFLDHFKLSAFFDIKFESGVKFHVDSYRRNVFTSQERRTNILNTKKMFCSTLFRFEVFLSLEWALSNAFKRSNCRKQCFSMIYVSTDHHHLSLKTKTIIWTIDCLTNCWWYRRDQNIFNSYDLVSSLHSTCIDHSVYWMHALTHAFNVGIAAWNQCMHSMHALMQCIQCLNTES